MKGVQIIRSLVVNRRLSVHASNITIIESFKGLPRRAFRVTHSNLTIVARTMAPITRITVQSLERTTLVLRKQEIGVIFGDSTVITTLTRKGRYARTGILFPSGV